MDVSDDLSARNSLMNFLGLLTIYRKSTRQPSNLRYSSKRMPTNIWNRTPKKLSSEQRQPRRFWVQYVKSAEEIVLQQSKSEVSMVTVGSQKMDEMEEMVVSMDDYNRIFSSTAMTSKDDLRDNGSSAESGFGLNTYLR
ncbi:unnamed protein product [Nesidiocoris tenuis]|uniref:Uncharacterized protein n=1 Tax=Nesidiocoris tenuis TaxID=355587 RepID=A0A6H5G2B0_9HEMI|nr:unnamed protein product [Nesidiocoris tenuis]